MMEKCYLQEQQRLLHEEQRLLQEKEKMKMEQMKEGRSNNVDGYKLHASIAS